MPGPYDSYVDIFGGNPVNPANGSFQNIELTEENSPYVLEWPVVGQQSGQIVTNQIQVTADEDDLSIEMPDATLASVGQVVIFFNVGNHAFNVLDADGDVIANVPVADGEVDPPTSGAVYIYLTDNTTAGGEWGVMSFGSLTGEVQASLLAGLGLVVDTISGKLDTNITVISTPGPTYNVKPTTLLPTQSDRAKFIIWTGGSGVVNFPPVTLATAGFFFAVGNQTSEGASITLQTPDGAKIDGDDTQILALSQTSIYATDGTNWFSLGLGIPTFFQTTVLVKDLSPYAGGSVILNNDEANRTIVTFVTNTTPLTSNITILWPQSPGFYYITNNITNNGFSLSIAANGGSVITPIPVGETFIFYNNGTDMNVAPTGIASGGIIFPDGTAAAPSIRFISDSSTGFYSPGSAKIGISVTASQLGEFDENGILIFPNGTRTDPSYAFQSVASTGIYLDVANTLVRFSYNNADCGGFGPAFLGLMNGTVGNPSLGFISDDTTGIYRVGAGAIGIASAGVAAANITGSGISTVNGSAASPSYYFIGDVNSGMYSVGANIVGITTDGALRMAVTSTSVELIGGTTLVFEEAGGANTLTLSVGAMTGDTIYVLPTDYPTVSGQVLSCTDAGVMSWEDNNVTNISLADGSEAAPSLSFVNYPDLGLYVSAADTLSVTANATEIVSFSTAGLTMASGQILALDGNTSNPAFSFINNPGDGLYRAGSSLYFFIAAGNPIFGINSNTLTIAPTNYLAFINPANTFSTAFTSAATLSAQVYTLPAAYPTTNGQPMISTTAGVMSWATSSFGTNSITIPNGAATITHQTPAAPAANYTYVWPADTPVAGDALRVTSVVGTTVTLEWAP